MWLVSFFHMLVRYDTQHHIRAPSFCRALIVSGRNCHSERTRCCCVINLSTHTVITSTNWSTLSRKHCFMIQRHWVNLYFGQGDILYDIRYLSKICDSTMYHSIWCSGFLSCSCISKAMTWRALPLSAVKGTLTAPFEPIIFQWQMWLSADFNLPVHQYLQWALLCARNCGLSHVQGAWLLPLGSF
jgi:hypothetical protein